MKLVLCCFILVGIYAAEGQVVFPGKCQDVKTMPNFDVEQYLGVWYEQERYFFVTEYNEDCVVVNYTLRDDGKVRVVNRGIIIGSTRIDEAVGEAYAPDPNFPAKLLVKFAGPPSNYWVLDTDYKTYTVVWSCRENQTREEHSVVTWILSRDRNGISEERREKIYSLLKQYDIDPNLFQNTNQKNCLI